MPTELPPPWRPMSEAPRDGTYLLAVRSHFNGVEVVFWGQMAVPPYTEGWVSFFEDIGNFECTEWHDEKETHWWAGWVPYPKEFVEFGPEKDEVTTRILPP